jgi:hypothetical protein
MDEYLTTARPIARTQPRKVSHPSHLEKSFVEIDLLPSPIQLNQLMPDPIESAYDKLGNFVYEHAD